MRILICDDHPVFAESLALMITRTGHTVVKVTYSPEQALHVLRRIPTDVCLLDLTFPDGTVLDRIAQLLAVSPGTRIVILSGLLEPHVLQAGIAVGVHGFAHKGQRSGEIIELLRRVHAGERVVERSMPRAVAPPRQRSPAQRFAQFLTPREREVLIRLTRGESTSALARAMGVTRNTARSHVQSVLTKLNVHSQREAVVEAARHGLVSIETGEWLLA